MKNRTRPESGHPATFLAQARRWLAAQFRKTMASVSATAPILDEITCVMPVESVAPRHLVDRQMLAGAENSGQQDWHPEDIKARIRKTGLSMSEVARRAGVPSHQLRHALVMPRAAGERVIAEYINVPPQRIWPSRYHMDGQRKRPQPRENYDRMASGSVPQ